VFYYQRTEARSFPKVEFVLNICDSGKVLLNVSDFVKFVADCYLLIGQFMLLTWSSNQKFANIAKTSDGHFNLFSIISIYMTGE